MFLKKISEIFSTNKFQKFSLPNKFSQKNFPKHTNQTSFPNKSLSHTHQINHFFQNSLSKQFSKTNFPKNQTKHVFVLFISKTHLSNTNQTYPISLIGLNSGLIQTPQCKLPFSSFSLFLGP